MLYMKKKKKYPKINRKKFCFTSNNNYFREKCQEIYILKYIQISSKIPSTIINHRLITDYYHSGFPYSFKAKFLSLKYWCFMV